MSTSQPPGCDHDHGLLVTTGRAWVACDGNNQLTVLALPQLTKLGRLDLGDGPDVLAADPARGLLYAAAESGDVTTVDTYPTAGRVHRPRPPRRGRPHRRRRPDHRRAYFSSPTPAPGAPAW